MCAASVYPEPGSNSLIRCEKLDVRGEIIRLFFLTSLFSSFLTHFNFLITFGTCLISLTFIKSNTFRLRSSHPSSLTSHLSCLTSQALPLGLLKDFIVYFSMCFLITLLVTEVIMIILPKKTKVNTFFKYFKIIFFAQNSNKK